MKTVFMGVHTSCHFSGGRAVTGRKIFLIGQLEARWSVIWLARNSAAGQRRIANLGSHNGSRAEVLRVPIC